MSEIKIREIKICDDVINVKFHYDKKSNIWHGDYPDFEESPRYAKDGRPWVNVISDACIHMKEESDDCGSCRFLKKECDFDLVGVCMNDEMKKNSKEDLK